MGFAQMLDAQNLKVYFRKKDDKNFSGVTNKEIENMYYNNVNSLQEM